MMNEFVLDYYAELYLEMINEISEYCFIEELLGEFFVICPDKKLRKIDDVFEDYDVELSDDKRRVLVVRSENINVDDYGPVWIVGRPEYEEWNLKNLFKKKSVVGIYMYLYSCDIKKG